MSANWRKITPAVVALCCAAAYVSADPLSGKDMGALEGKWSIDERETPEQFLNVEMWREGGLVVRTAIRLKIRGWEGYLDYIGQVQFETITGKTCIALHPVVAQVSGLPELLAYKIAGNDLILHIAEGKYKGEYTFHRVQQK